MGCNKVSTFATFSPNISLLLSDLCEQRGRMQRLRQSGERKEERLCALWCPGNHLRETLSDIKRREGRVSHTRSQEEMDPGKTPVRDNSLKKLEFELKCDAGFSTEDTLLQVTVSVPSLLPLSRERCWEGLPVRNHCITGFYLIYRPYVCFPS